jgi:hypothetical protein
MPRLVRRIRRSHPAVSCLIAAIALLAPALVTHAPPASAASPTRLAVIGLASPPRSAIAGTAFHVTDVTRNVGPGPSGRKSTTVFLASRDRRASAGDVVLGSRPVRPLAPGGTSRARRSITIPAATRPGTYWLIACAGTSTRSRHHAAAACRSAGRRIRILNARPVNRSAPRVNGTTVDGSSLAADDGAWRGLPPIAYKRQWQRCAGDGSACAPMPSATTPTYVLTAADVGSTIRVAVVGQNGRGAGSALSRTTAPVRPAPPANTAPPGVAGAVVTGAAITASPGTWAGTPPLTYTFQWQRCDGSGNACADIGGANTDTYTVVPGDNATMLKVVVGAQNAAGNGTAASVPATAGLFQNPVAGSAPDPYVLDLGGRHSDYYAFATGNLFPVMRSTDLVRWTAAGRAMATRPTWVVAQGDWHPWAPSVVAAPLSSCPGTATGKCFAMYYTGLSATYGVNCVAVATATAPGGPYVDQGPLTLAGDAGQPQGCADSAGRGNIDPSPFIDADGRAYLYTATDFSPTGLQPTVSVTPLADDLTHASGPRVPLFSGDANTWEAAGVSAPTVEGPMMVLHNGTYYLFYSGGSWQKAYGMGYATGSGPTGPFTKSASNPIFAETPSVLSPGGGDTPVAGVRGGLWMLYHARANSYNDPRTMRIDRLLWQPGSPDAPVLGGPSATPLTSAP